ncbi:MAG TPA: alkaline phosphatase family protein, partial [Chitinophagaceae bacterium]|nr:alkaline phosphatase family protein [Chitinophagaceae bacterium]
MNRLLILFLLLSAQAATAQQRVENVIVVTLDGLRWQELYGGADTALVNNKEYTRNPKDVQQQYGGATTDERRRKLFPFIWNTVAAQGRLYGNQWEGSRVEVANRYRFSYPGYNELLTGYPDTAVNSNDKIPNKNVNVLEFLQGQPAFRNKVAAFATWDVFPYILNRERGGFYVNADFDSVPRSVPGAALLNDLQTLTTRPIGVRPDLFTYVAAREYLKQHRPRVLYIAFDETDDFAHSGQYDQYLMSARAQDGMIADLWKTMQALPQYRDKTALIITTDHGRGDSVKAQWRDHGEGIPEAAGIWMAVLVPGMTGTGEQKGGE